MRTQAPCQAVRASSKNRGAFPALRTWRRTVPPVVGRKPFRIVDHDRGWAERFAETGAALRSTVGDDAVRIDHIGSTSVVGLAAKEVVDIQVTVARLADGDRWPDELLPSQ